MIEATFTRNRSGFLEHAELKGHAGSGEYGFDIVCASVSSLALNFVNSLDLLAECSADVDINERTGGYMAISLPPGSDREEKVQLLFESFFLGIANLAEHSAEFVTLKVLEN
ncbi:ribosomal-processing cysteine protease Prp [Streptococcus chenjunshii]|uniref:Ribosomal processing cysteine protease Prp n=1 Tax=Streptococcus chenjunshii TaxID=2173853 RepID=A0A372KJ01_9STRE|nr:ribosomal-processing cysteine protease Prp [Streptococcus chenjunshii]AXQ78872.1 ribosomal-processing cysteine protease Prp [Streptococcus chenjunshii]RFU50120.1 ribosomal-processing cysteine protease Prp [Streptococcus chenjunshii]RFU52272.1 ribosomal-processing cysteine protease Prp [Streptococcus chenjunshii]